MKSIAQLQNGLLLYAILILLSACQSGDTTPKKDDTVKENIESAAKNAAAAITEAAEKTVRGMGDVKTDLDRLITDLEMQGKTLATAMESATQDGKTEIQAKLDKIKAAQNRIAERMSSVSVERKDKATMVEELTEMVREIRADLNLPEEDQPAQ